MLKSPAKPTTQPAPSSSRGKALQAAFFTLLIGLGIWQIAQFTQHQSLAGLRSTGELRVNLYASSLRDTLERYRHLPYVLSRDARVIALLENQIPSIRVSPHLEDFGLKSDALIYVLDRGGTTVASSNWRTEQSLLGHNFSFRPYFTDARDGRTGGYYAVGLRTFMPGYFLSYPVRNNGVFLGVIVVKVNLEPMQEAWKKSGETVIVSDGSGVIFLTSNGDWKYHSLRVLPQKTIKRLQAVQYLNQPLPALQLTRQRLHDLNIVEIEKSRYLEQGLQLPEYGWRLHYLTNMQSVEDDVKLSVSLSTIFGVLIFLTFLYFRERKQKLLSMQEARRVEEIESINKRLRREIEEHKHTMDSLQRTQKELVQAGKLAALGRMSAAIAHELNQPVTAIRTFIASSKVFLERGETEKVVENLEFIGRLTQRMGAITSQLKTFARKSKGKEERIDLAKTITQVMQLVSPQVKSSGASITADFPQEVVAVKGDSLQVEQVLSNLILNGLDAVKHVEEKQLSLSVELSGNMVTIVVCDTGRGISDEALDNLFDPFYTTKDVGEGLGLGLSISYGIIQEMGGSISAENIPGGGAQFTVSLPRLNEE